VTSSTDNISAVRAWCGEHPWLVGIGIAGLMAIGTFYRPETTSDRKYFGQLLSVWVEFAQLREDEASPEQWQAFAKRVEQQMAPVVAELSETASPQQPALRHLLWAARDCLPAMIQEGPTDLRQAELEFLEHLRKAEWYLKQTR
jgi:hypothetical protein